MKTERSNFSALTTDLYEVTMAYGYWKAGVSDYEGAFHLIFRENPFGGEFTVACGLGQVIDVVREFQFRKSELDYLTSQCGNDGKPLFDSEFLDYLRNLQVNCDIDAMPEGTLVFPNEPLLRIRGPIIQCQLLETVLLNIFNFQSLIATKAARVCLAAQNDAVIEYGLRRAQGVDGGLSAARAAYIGGCAGTSNLQAGERFGIPVSGTQAHSWIMFFEDEREAFEIYARALPNNCVFLVDTYNSLDGVRRAIEVGKRMQKDGHEIIGVRLDSGDRTALSIKAREMLDGAGFRKAKIVCSGDLDEFAVAEMKKRGAKIDIWGVGTRLTTGQPDAALGGIYKLSAVRRPGENWKYRIKLSEEAEKISCPGLLQVRRYSDANERFIADRIYEIDHRISNESGQNFVDLLQPIFRKGELVYKRPTIDESREYARNQLAQAPPDILKLENPRRYDVSLEKSLDELRSTLIARAKEQLQ
jgi:nicotinate phosphoribosyltransferase